MFWPVVYTSLAVSAATFVVVYGYWRWWPNRRHKRRVKDMAAMRDLLVHHVDDLDDILDKLRHGTCEYARWHHAVLSCCSFLLHWASNAVRHFDGLLQCTGQGSEVHHYKGCLAQQAIMIISTVMFCVCVSAQCLQHLGTAVTVLNVWLM